MPAFARLYQSYAEPASAKGSVRIAREPAECDARLDGKLVLATDTDLSAAEVARSYQLSEPVTGGPHLPRGEIYPKGPAHLTPSERRLHRSHRGLVSGSAAGGGPATAMRSARSPGFLASSDALPPAGSDRHHRPRRPTLPHPHRPPPPCHPGIRGRRVPTSVPDGGAVVPQIEAQIHFCLLIKDLLQPQSAPETSHEPFRTDLPNGERTQGPALNALDHLDPLGEPQERT